MAAQIIPFPKLEVVKEGLAVISGNVPQNSVAPRNDPATHLHIVRPSAFSRSQQTAKRIVADVCLEHHLHHPATEVPERSPAFWATLPLPPARVETPVSVAKRIAHLLLPVVAEHA